MNHRLRLALVLGAGAGIVASCGKHHDSAPPPISGVPGSGGTRSGFAGRGSGGSKAGGAAGEGGAGADAGGSSAGTHHSGGGGTSGAGNGEAGSLETAGGGGVPFFGDPGSNGASSNGGAPGPGEDAGRIYIGPGGYDGATGTRDNPFLTLAAAAAIAQRGDTLVFLDGNYTISSGADAVAIPDGVDLTADNPRFASLTGDGGTLLELDGDSRIDGLNFDGFETVVASDAAGASIGVTNVTFSNCPSNSGKSVFEVGGGASVSVTDDVMHDLGDCPALGHVYGQGKLVVDGETLHFTGNGESAVFVAEGSAELDLSNLIATDGNLPLLLVRDTSTTTLATSTLETLASHVVDLQAQASLAVTSTNLAVAASVSTAAPCIQTNNGPGSSLTLTQSVVHGCTGALVGPSPKTLTLDGTEIYAMSASGLDLTTGATSSVTITGSHFHDEGARAVRLGGGSPASFVLSVRGTTVDSVSTGFELDGDASSTWDFGTLASPGNNVLTATTTSLAVEGGTITFVSAVGNTWTASVQNADASGHYAPASSPGVLEVTSGSGQNYTDTAGATIRLAESN